MLTQDTINILKQFNENCEWLRSANSTFLSDKNLNVIDDWIDVQQALSIFKRSATWLRCRMLKEDQVKQPMNVNWFLIHGVDWAHEGKKIVFKRTSVLRLKAEMLNIGIEMRLSKRVNKLQNSLN